MLRHLLKFLIVRIRVKQKQPKRQCLADNNNNNNKRRFQSENASNVFRSHYAA